MVGAVCRPVRVALRLACNLITPSIQKGVPASGSSAGNGGAGVGLVGLAVSMEVSTLGASMMVGGVSPLGGWGLVGLARGSMMFVSPTPLGARRRFDDVCSSKHRIRSVRAVRKAYF